MGMYYQNSPEWLSRMLCFLTIYTLTVPRIEVNITLASNDPSVWIGAYLYPSESFTWGCITYHCRWLYWFTNSDHSRLPEHRKPHNYVCCWLPVVSCLDHTPPGKMCVWIWDYCIIVKMKVCGTLLQSITPSIRLIIAYLVHPLMKRLCMDMANVT